MNPLSLFPTLFSYEFFAPTLLRVFLALFLVYLGLKRRNKNYSITSIIYFVSSISLFLGLYAQVGAILSIVSLKFDFYLDYWKDRGTNPIFIEKYFLYGLAVVIALSILVTGPGAFAFDLPL